MEYEEREEYIVELKEERDLLAKLLTEDKAYDYDIARLEDVMDEIDSVERIHRGERDVLYFGMSYFGEDLNPDNPDNLIPTDVNVGNAATFHKELTKILDDVAMNDVKRHFALAVPRRHAKTAWLSNIFLIHQVVYRLKRYIVLYSETTDVAGDFITWGRYQLKLNEKLRSDFGEVLYLKPSMNELDNKYEFITTTKVKVEAKGLGTQVRGLRHGSTRPDLFILDDLESSETTNTPELIEKSKTWFREEMLPALSKEGLVVYMGTILAYSSLLHYVVEERNDFDSRKYAAIERYATRTDLWAYWREIYRSDSKTSADDAISYFKKNEVEMLKGTKILWPGYFTYYELIQILEDNGAKAFNQEYQNNPTDEERQIFKPEHITWFDEGDLEGKKLEYYAGIDFAMGKEKGDFSAIATIAKNKETNINYVVDIYMERIHPDVLLEEAVQQTLHYQYDGIGVESVMAQEWFADKLYDELATYNYPSHSRLKKINQRTRKSLRIEALLPDIQSGRLRFINTLRNSNQMAQFELYPMHPNDDAPDAVSMALSTASSGLTTVKSLRSRTR